MSYKRVYAPKHPSNPYLYWCQNCQIWVKLEELKRWLTDDDWREDMLCPGCDLVILEIVYDPDDDV